MRNSLQLSPVRGLLAIALVLGLSGGAAAAGQEPVPPCGGAARIPTMPPSTHRPLCRSSAARTLPPGSPPLASAGRPRKTACWWRLPVASISSGTTDELLKRFGAISSLKGLQYWSVTDGGWRTLIDSASALDSPDTGHSRADFTLAEMKSGHELYFAQQDNRTSEEVVYRMKVSDLDRRPVRRRGGERDPGQELHADPVRSRRPAIGALRERESPGVFRFYGLAFAGESLAVLARSARGVLRQPRARTLRPSQRHEGRLRREVTRLRPLPRRGAALAIERANSSSVSSIFTAATFSSRCATFEVPGIGSITGLRFSTQASAIWPGAASWRLGDAVEHRARLGEIAGGERKPRDEADAVRLAIIEHVLAAAIDEIVAVLHASPPGTPWTPPRCRRPTPRYRPAWRMMPSSSSDLIAANCSSRGTLGSMRCSCQSSICFTPSCLQLLSACWRSYSGRPSISHTPGPVR